MSPPALALPMHREAGMRHTWLARALVVVVTLAALAFGSLGAARAERAPEDRILPLDQYTSDKARRLAARYAEALRALNRTVYACLPWLEVKQHGIGFFKPRHLTGDVRYLALNVVVDQEPSPQFSAYPREERAARMFSRYVGPLLRRMAHDRALLAEPMLDGFTVILSWLKAVPRGAERPVHETIAVFVPRDAAAEYVAGRAGAGQLAEWAHVLAWDGETALGPLKLTAWDDDFVATYRVANYQPDPATPCR